MSILKKSVSSLFYLSSECVIVNLQLYTEYLEEIPLCLKENILKKFLKQRRNFPAIKILTALVYTHLKCLNLSMVDVDGSTLRTLIKCPNLTDLDLKNSDNQQTFSSQELRDVLHILTKLLTLDVSHCQQFTDDVMQSVAISCKNLRELRCEGCSVTNLGLLSLSQHNPQIECLTISYNQITGDAVSEAVKNWKFLRELRIDSCLDVNDGVLLKIIQSTQMLEILTFCNCPIIGESPLFQEIHETCTKLKQLYWTYNW